MRSTTKTESRIGSDTQMIAKMSQAPPPQIAKQSAANTFYSSSLLIRLKLSRQTYPFHTQRGGQLVETRI